MGRTPWCESIDQAIPVVGDLYNLDYEMLIRLNPTHILVQPPATGIDEALTTLAHEQGWVIGQWRLDDIDDIETLVQELPGVLSGDDRSMLGALSSKAASLTNELAMAVSPMGKKIFDGRTLLVVDFDPVMSFGPGSYLHDMLVSLGGHNALESGSYKSLSLEDVIRLNPEAIVFVKPYKSDPSETPDPLELLGPLRETNLEAVVTGRIAVLSHPDALLPSTGLIEVASSLRDILVSFATGDP
ncbi:MAG: hypothetical protein O7G85_00845 [Planctomycetota bacterium]|nr:hypothetical protein [Planctomycetota bacterium]